MPKIKTIDIYRVRVPLISPFRTAYGSDAAVEPVLVRMSDGTHHGWGEAQAFHFPTYCPEHAAGVFVTIRDVLAPALVGRDLPTGESLHEALTWFKGNPFAKGALDMAWWDLHARIRNEPLWKAIGGQNNVIDVGADFGVMDTIDALLEKVGQAVDAGYKRIKLKFAPGWDVGMVSAVRAAFPDAVFHIDCNSAYTLDDLAMFKRLDKYNLAMIEQPLTNDDLIDHATLQRQIDTPICLDESITSPAKARKAIEVEACRWINIKPVRVGGLTPALKIHDLCAKANIPCWVGGMVETALGVMHCAAMASLPNIKYPSDVFPSSRFFDPDLADSDLQLTGPGQITLPDAPGIGCVPKQQLLDEWTLDRATITEKEALSTGATIGGR